MKSLKVIAAQCLVLVLLLLITDRVLLPIFPDPDPSKIKGLVAPWSSQPSKTVFSAYSLKPSEPWPQYRPEDFKSHLITPSATNFIETYAPGIEERLELSQFFYIHPLYGRSLVPNAQPRHQLFDHGKFIYDVIYHHDEFGRRITPVTGSRDRKKFIALLGCSYTYGDGVRDTETIPYYLGQMLPDYFPINYGVGGSAAHYFAKMLGTRDLSKEVQQTEGIGIYLYFDNHLERIIGSSAWWHTENQYPYYELNSNGGLELHGTFQTGRPWLTRFYEFFEKSNFRKKFNLRLPLWLTPYHLELTCSVLEELKNQFVRQFHRDSFYVGFLPDSMRDYDELSSCLNKKGVNTLDLRNAYNGFAGELSIPYDMHPTANANQLLAHAIVESLKLH